MTRNERIRVGDRVTIFRRGQLGIWCADFSQDGRHQKVSLKTTNKKVATERAVKLAGELVAGTYRQIANTATLATALGDYLRYLETEGRARKTIVRYRGELMTFCEYCRSQRVLRLAQITPTLYDRFRAERRQDHCLRTMYHEGMVAKQFLKWCVSRHLIAKNPLQDYKLQEPPLTRKAAPTLAELQRILAASTPRQRLMLAVLAATGMRSGELQRLRREDVDLEGNWIHIVSREGAETKTRQSRQVPLHPALKLLLRDRPAVPGPWFFAAEPSAKYPAGGHWISGKRLNETFTATVGRVGLRAGRDGNGYTIHSLRRFFQTFCVHAGIPQRVIDTWLGHVSDHSMGAVYYCLSDIDSQTFMFKVPFGDGALAADASSESKE